MMGLGPEESGRLDVWTYQALLHNWNLAHAPSDAPRALDPERRERLERAMKAHAVH